MRKQILKSMLAIGIITFAVTITECSCGKTGGGGNSGGGGNGGDNGPPPVPTTNLVLTNEFSATWVKLSSNTATVRAGVASGTGVPSISSANDSDRGYADSAGKTQRLFDIVYPGATAVIVWVSRAHVTKDTITIKAASNTYCSSSESGDNALATAVDGGHCRRYNTTGNIMDFESYLGTVFNNTKTNTHARGMLVSQAQLRYSAGVGTVAPPITDATAFNRKGYALIYMAELNNAGTAASAVMDDAWVGDSASVKEVELYAIGIDVSDKTIEQISGLKKADFDKALDNAAFKRLLRNNPWGELKFKIKLVTAADFAALP